MEISKRTCPNCGELEKRTDRVFGGRQIEIFHCGTSVCTHFKDNVVNVATSLACDERRQGQDGVVHAKANALRFEILLKFYVEDMEFWDSKASPNLEQEMRERVEQKLTETGGK